MRKKTAICVSVILGILICAVFVCIPISEAHKEQQYEQALALYDEKLYDAAYDLFYLLRDWKAEANAYAHICRARVLLSQGKPSEARREMSDVSVKALPDDLAQTIQSVNRAIDSAISSAQPARTSAPAPTPRPVWTPAPSSRKWYDEDEYNTSDYDDPENFYEDHYDDFIDYYDAEDYWYDHYDD